MIFTTFHDEKLFEAISQFKTRIEADPPTVGNFICWLNYITSKGMKEGILTNKTVPTGSKPFKCNPDKCSIQ